MSYLKFGRRLNPNFAKLHNAAWWLVLNWNLDREQVQLGLTGGRRKKMVEWFLEEFTVGQTFGSGHLKIDAEEIKRFAANFDPQPFHLDEQAASKSLFRGLAASGWHTTALTMKLLVESEFKPAGGIVGASFDELRWPKPVRPGDELRVQTEVLQINLLKSRPELGFVKVKVTTLNQAAEAVQVCIGNLVVLRRPQVKGKKSDS